MSQAQPQTGWRGLVPSVPSTGPGIGGVVGWQAPVGGELSAVVPAQVAGSPVELSSAAVMVADGATAGSGDDEGVEDPALGDSTSGDSTPGDPEPQMMISESEPDTSSAALAETPIAAALQDETLRRIAVGEVQVQAPAEPRIMTVANQKGGVGKTTTTVNVAAALAQAGLQILVIDVDPQGNASTALGIDHHAEVPSIYDVVVDGKPLAGVVQECPDVRGLWCAPATIDLAGAEIELVSMVARETRLDRAITALLAERRFDYVLIDCPPSLGLLTVNAFVAAREVFIPIQCEYYALEGLSQLLSNIEMIKAHLNPDLLVSTILMTMYDGRTKLSSQVAAEVRSHFSEQVLKASIPRSVRISEAPSHGQTVMTYDPSSSGALSYLEAAKELASRA